MEYPKKITSHYLKEVVHIIPNGPDGEEHSLTCWTCTVRNKPALTKFYVHPSNSMITLSYDAASSGAERPLSQNNDLQLY